MGIETLLGHQGGSKNELDVQQLVAKLAEAVSFYSKRKELGKQITKSSRGRAVSQGRRKTQHEGLYVRLPDLGAGPFAIKIGTTSQVFRIQSSSGHAKSAGGQPLIGGESWSSTSLEPLKIRELRDDQALAIYCSLCAMAVEDAKELKASLPKPKKAKSGSPDKDDSLGATGHR